MLTHSILISTSGMTLIAGIVAWSALFVYYMERRRR